MDLHSLVDCGAPQGSKAGSHDPKRTHLRPQPFPISRTAPKPHHKVLSFHDSLRRYTAPLHGSIRPPERPRPGFTSLVSQTGGLLRRRWPLRFPSPDTKILQRISNSRLSHGTLFSSRSRRCMTAEKQNLHHRDRKRRRWFLWRTDRTRVDAAGRGSREAARTLIYQVSENS